MGKFKRKKKWGFFPILEKTPRIGNTEKKKEEKNKPIILWSS